MPGLEWIQCSGYKRRNHVKCAENTSTLMNNFILSLFIATERSTFILTMAYVV